MPHVTRSILKRHVDSLLALAPVGAELVHEALEMRVVVALPKMRKLVDDDVFEAGNRIFGELQIQPDAARADVAGAPLRLHVLDAPFSGALADDRLCSRQERRHGSREFATIPFVQQSFTLSGAALGLLRLEAQDESAAVSQDDVAATSELHGELERLAPDKEALAA